jgi:hypothetical protein
MEYSRQRNTLKDNWSVVFNDAFLFALTNPTRLNLKVMGKKE